MDTLAAAGDPMTEDQDLERCRLAYSRAGYAVARHTQGERVPNLSMDLPAAPPVPDEGHTPRNWEVAMGSRARHRTELEILARWTGLVSESRACLGDREPPGGWGAAREPIAALARRITRNLDENDAYLEWLRQRAIGLIDLPEIWAAVEAVAKALLAKGQVGYREASDIVAGVQRARRRWPGLSSFFNPR